MYGGLFARKQTFVESAVSGVDYFVVDQTPTNKALPLRRESDKQVDRRSRSELVDVRASWMYLVDPGSTSEHACVTELVSGRRLSVAVEACLRVAAFPVKPVQNINGVSVRVAV